MNAKSAPAAPGERWFETLLGLLPFIFWPLMIAAGAGLNLVVGSFPALAPPLEAAAPLAVGLFFLFCWILLTGVTAAGGVSGWPSWAFSNLGVLLLVSFFVSLLARQEGTILGQPFSGSLLFSWLAWSPPALVVLIVLLAARSFSPLSVFAKAVGRDWTRLSFGVYACAPVALIAGFDHIDGGEYFLAGLIVLLGLGGWGYLRTPRLHWRFVWLAAAFWLAWAIAAAITFFYWRGRIPQWSPHPATGWDELAGFLSTGGQILTALCLPGALTALAAALGRLARRVVPGH